MPRMEAVADWEFAPLRIPADPSRSAAATMLSLQAETGGWELARLQLHADGTRKVIMRRRARLSYLPKPVLLHPRAHAARGADRGRSARTADAHPVGPAGAAAAGGGRR